MKNQLHPIIMKGALSRLTCSHIHNLSSFSNSLRFHSFLVRDLFLDRPVVQSDEASTFEGSAALIATGENYLTYGYVHVKLSGSKLLSSEDMKPWKMYTHIHVPFIPTPCCQIHEHESRPKHCRIRGESYILFNKVEP